MYELLSDCGTPCMNCFLTVELYVRATFRLWNDMYEILSDCGTPSTNYLRLWNSIYELLSDCGTPCTSYFLTVELHQRVTFFTVELH